MGRKKKIHYRENLKRAREAKAQKRAHIPLKNESVRIRLTEDQKNKLSIIGGGGKGALTKGFEKIYEFYMDQDFPKGFWDD